MKAAGLILVVACGVACLLTGCVSKAKADARARAAFFAGQQQAAQNLMLQGPMVTIVGEVRNSVLPWTSDLTLAKAVLAAEYQGGADPSEILVIREGEEIQVDPKRLLEGEDVHLRPRDIIELKR